MAIDTTYYVSTLGTLVLTADTEALLSCQFLEASSPPAAAPLPSPLLTAALEQLTAYFAGQLTHFDLPLRPQGTDFRQQVWQALQHIPYGNTRSYSEIAQAIGRPKAVRAIGQANHHNPLLIFIPCHRVVSQRGALTGYAAGLERKAWLLQHEQHH